MALLVWLSLHAKLRQCHYLTLAHGPKRNSNPFTNRDNETRGGLEWM
jgi:hypothetical protein